MDLLRTPCTDGNCLRGPDTPPWGNGSEIGMKLCRNMGARIIAAGGASLLEAYPCPWDAVLVIGPESDDPAIKQIRDGIGIVGFYNEEQR